MVHTNLGRSRLAESAVERVAEVARSYSNLEYDLEHGDRGRREAHVEALLTRLTGAEDAFVVNNNAGAVLLLLMALAAGREVLVSRGQLVEIGGSFRMPDIMRAGGVRLVEVGTTNRTRVGRLRSGHHPRDGPAAARAHLQLPHPGLHRGDRAGGAGGAGPAPGTAGRRRPGQRRPARARRLPGGADGGGLAAGGRRPGLLQRRQAPGRSAGGHPAGAGRGDTEAAQASGGAGPPPGQDDPGGAGGHAAPLSGPGAGRARDTRPCAS